jgi:hypothetical protein
LDCLAVRGEKRFTEDTIRKWRPSGRLMNDWEEAQARPYLETSEFRGQPDDSKGVSTVKTQNSSAGGSGRSRATSWNGFRFEAS